VNWTFLASAEGPPAGEEHRSDLKDEIEQVRHRAIRLLDFLATRSETRIAVFTHQGLIRNIGAVVVGLGRHHSPAMLSTGSAFKVVLVGDPEAAEQARWQLDPTGPPLSIHPIC
jgi:broad specificity phosphatase PhoE